MQQYFVMQNVIQLFVNWCEDLVARENYGECFDTVTRVALYSITKAVLFTSTK